MRTRPTLLYAAYSAAGRTVVKRMGMATRAEDRDDRCGPDIQAIVTFSGISAFVFSYPTEGYFTPATFQTIVLPFGSSNLKVEMSLTRTISVCV